MREISKQECFDLESSLGGAWQDEAIVQKQLDLTTSELAAWHAGQIDDDAQHPYAALAHLMGIVDAVVSGFMALNVLELGCATGYNSEVLQPGYTRYLGIDYSEAFIAKATELHADAGHVRTPPGRVSFAVGDARALELFDGSYDMVIEGSVIIHVPEWQSVLSEAIRVSKRYVILHRTPYSPDDTFHYYIADAYGVECLRIHFSRTEVEAFMVAEGLVKRHAYALQSGPDYEYDSSLWEKTR